MVFILGVFKKKAVSIRRFLKNLPFSSWFWCDHPPEVVLLFKLKCPSGRLEVDLLSSEPTSVAKRQLVRTPQAKSLVHNMLSPPDLIRTSNAVMYFHGPSSQPWVNNMATKDFRHFQHHSMQLLKGH